MVRYVSTNSVKTVGQNNIMLKLVKCMDTTKKVWWIKNESGFWEVLKNIFLKNVEHWMTHTHLRKIAV